ncbi:MAG: hypothetical protein ACM3MG_03825 [Bacillota bacterium]
MESFSQIEIYNSLLFLRKLLGVTNDKRNQPLQVGIRYTGTEILATNESSSKAVLLLKKNAVGAWLFSGTSMELEPISSHIERAISKSTNHFLSEPAFDALQEIFKLPHKSSTQLIESP